MSRFRSLAFAAALLGMSATAAEPPVSPQTFFRHADFAQARISPSGRQLAALAPVNGRRGIVVLDLDTRKARVVASMDQGDVRSFHWVNERRLVFDVEDLHAGLGEQYLVGGLFAIDVDGGDLRVLSRTAKSQYTGGSFVFRYTRLGRLLGDGSDDIIGYSNERNRDYEDAYRINTRDGRRTLLTSYWPGDPVRWVADRNGVVRAALTTEKTLTYRMWWRETADAPWQLLTEYGRRDAGIAPVAFDADGSLIVASDRGRDTYALYRYDVGKKALGELLAAHPHADLTSVETDPRTGKVVGVRYFDGKPGYAWFDDEWARIAAVVDRALPGRFNAISRGEANRMLVTSVSDTDPGVWYLLDLDARKLEFLASVRKDLRPGDMPKREFLRYPARDGLSIPAMLTLPKGRDAKGLPLVLYVHGGPYVRSMQWSWRDEPAFLASLGYVVLEPDFRGSMGWGRKLFHAGWRQWGLAMQDDLVDGIDWLAARGTIDPKRVCIMGASYGGYAVMMGLARDPDRFRCGINYVGVTDIGMMFTVAWSDFAYSDFLKYGAKEMIGDPDRDAEQLRRTSPLHNAAKIKAPVLMAYGGSDYRVPIVHGEEMRDALRKHGTPVEWIVYPDEGHGWLLERNRFDFYGRVAQFLAEHLPAK